MRKKLLSMTMMVAVLAMLVLSGCGAGTSDGGDSVSASTLTKVIKNQKLTVGCILANEPFGSYDEEGNPIGYDVDVAYLLADSLGIAHENVEFLNLKSEERVPALESGKCDVVIGNFTVTLERAQKIEFTDPYDAAGTAVLTAPGKEIEHASELAGKKVGASKGTMNAEAGQALIDSGVDFELVLYDDSDAQELALKSGQLDAIIGETAYCAYKAKQYPENFSYCIEDSSEMLVPVSYNAFGVAQGDQIWLNYLNQFITDINSSGENNTLYEKWLGEERTISLNPQY